MPVSLSFSYAKLTEAVEIFVNHEDDARQRLLAAEIPLTLISSEDLPEPYNKEWATLWSMLTDRGTSQDFSPFQYTVLQMRKKRAAQFIGEIWNMMAMLDSFIRRGPH
ncbi:MAG: hypothetical protein WBB32_06525 [Flavobacteriales bacterium]|nr:hypothetical protein [Flavobacteriales bacterium]